MERSLTDAGLQAGRSAGRALAEASLPPVSGLDLSGLLRSRFQGELVSPGDPGYDQARRARYLTVDQRPALIAAPQDAEDVIEAVHFARKLVLKIEVQSTGHGTVRPADGSLLLLTSRPAAGYKSPIRSGGSFQPGFRSFGCLTQLPSRSCPIYKSIKGR